MSSPFDLAGTGSRAGPGAPDLTEEQRPEAPISGSEYDSLHLCKRTCPAQTDQRDPAERELSPDTSAGLTTQHKHYNQRGQDTTTPAIAAGSERTPGPLRPFHALLYRKQEAGGRNTVSRAGWQRVTGAAQPSLRNRRQGNKKGHALLCSETAPVPLAPAV
ncbi:hypothetical protein SKAU_G00380010 [Synaphobranchus kaupii]|uniref:Uncharacterized protein n=1 Tax=Synaphobranchus kaupii TaxID=118154 RepID=A0A9Q1IEL3_SYNKA|nr:hypothetical protein SKAU_G00380010 [Synaphobranchus kaupii]